jgi:uncharacterized protein (DUF1778 family)
MQRVLAYFSPEEKQLIELAAERSGLSVSFYTARATLQKAITDMSPGLQTPSLTVPSAE